MMSSLSVVAVAKVAKRPVADPPLPVGWIWQTSKLTGGFEGRYLAKASILDWNRNWNNGRVRRFDMKEAANYLQKGFHLEDDTVIEKTYCISGRRGHKLKHQYVIRLTYQL